MCKELGLTLTPTNVDLVAEMNSSVCILILLDMSAAGTLPKSPPHARWKGLENKDALWEDLWMLSYEAGVRSWGGMSDAHVKADPHFEAMRVQNVHFCETTASITPLFAPKPDALKQHNLQTVAQLLKLDNLDDVFEHEDEEDDYGSPIESDEEDDDEL